MTTTLPEKVPQFLPTTKKMTGADAGAHEWNYRHISMYHNGSRNDFPHLPSLHELSTHKTLGLLLSHDGQLHMYINGHHLGCIATELPVHKPLFGAVDVCFHCTKIKSEILSGELDFVCICASL